MSKLCKIGGCGRILDTTCSWGLCHHHYRLTRKDKAIAAVKKWADAHKEERRKYGINRRRKFPSLRQRHHLKNKEHDNEMNRKWHAAHQEEVSKRHKDNYMRNGEVKRAQNRYYNRTPKGRYLQSIRTAKARQLEFSLTFEKYCSLIESGCYYCGFPGPEAGSGLDRINCFSGYVIDNVVPCCTECNCAKNANFTKSEMEIIGKSINEVKGNRIVGFLVSKRLLESVDV